jgi:hypothetical protein
VKKLAFLASALLLASATPAIAWDGYDMDTGNYVEIDKGNLVREGSSAEVYDWDTGRYHDVEVKRINSYGSSVELEVYDYDTGEYRILEMDD